MATTAPPAAPHITPAGRRLPRALRDAEKVLDIDGILDIYDQARDLLGETLEAWRRKAARAVVQRLPVPPPPRRALLVLLALREAGRRQAAGELHRLGLPLRGVRGMVGEGLFGEPGADEALMQLMILQDAPGIAPPPELERYWVRLTARLNDVEFEFRRGLPTGGVDAIAGSTNAQIQERLLNEVPGLADAVTNLISGPFQVGVDDVFSVHADLFGGFEYSAILDAATCDVCRPLDGTRYATVEAMYAVLPGFGPNPACRGGWRCRCRGIPLPPEPTPRPAGPPPPPPGWSPVTRLAPARAWSRGETTFTPKPASALEVGERARMSDGNLWTYHGEEEYAGGLYRAFRLPGGGINGGDGVKFVKGDHVVDAVLDGGGHVSTVDGPLWQVIPRPDLLRRHLHANGFVDHDKMGGATFTASRAEAIEQAGGDEARLVEVRVNVQAVATPDQYRDAIQAMLREQAADPAVDAVKRVRTANFLEEWDLGLRVLDEAVVEGYVSRYAVSARLGDMGFDAVEMNYNDSKIRVFNHRKVVIVDEPPPPPRARPPGTSEGGLITLFDGADVRAAEDHLVAGVAEGSRPSYATSAQRTEAKRRIETDLYARLRENDDWNTYVNTRYGNPSDGARQAGETAQRQAVRELIDCWAGTSADHNPTALALQRAVREEFGLDANVLHDPLQFVDDAVRNGEAHLYGLHGPGYRVFVRGMYENTQDEFAARGITHVSVTRGMGLPFDSPAGRAYRSLASLTTRIEAEMVQPWSPAGEALRGAVEAGHLEAPTVHGLRIDVTLQPASSFSTSSGTAGAFGPSLIAGRIPVARILSSSRTGWGCLNESEFVVLGGTDEWVLMNAYDASHVVYGGRELREEALGRVLSHGHVWDHVPTIDEVAQAVAENRLYARRRRGTLAVNADLDPLNADWIKTLTWDVSHRTVPALSAFLEAIGWPLAAFLAAPGPAALADTPGHGFLRRLASTG